MPLTLLTGGVRSGKSALAVQIAGDQGADVVFIATAQPGDADMTARIERHRRDRPEGWSVVEEPLDLEGSLRNAPVDACVVVDCLTLWVSNLMLAEREEDAIEEQASGALAVVGHRSGPTIVVTNEVGSGVHPTTELGRRYAEVLGRVNAMWGRAADDAYLVVAGRTVRLT